jgi:hypothetical protein
MKFFSLTTLLASAAAQSDFGETMPTVDMAVKYPKIAGSYIVVFHPGTEDAVVASHMTSLQGKSVPHTVTREYHIKPAVKANEFRGYAVRVSAEAAALLSQDPAVKYGA